MLGHKRQSACYYWNVLSRGSQIYTLVARLNEKRQELLNALRDVNEERDKVDLMETAIGKEYVHPIRSLFLNIQLYDVRCTDLKAQIQTISDGEFASAKREVDALRAELGQGPTPTLQQLVEEKSAA